jgi:adenylate cyclase
MRPPRWAFETWLTCAFVSVGALWGGLLGARHLDGRGSALDRLEYVTVDWRFTLAGARPVPRAVVIAAIDEETVRRAGGYPLPRELLARIVGAVAVHKPHAIAVDMLFLDPGKPEADRALADALRTAGAVVAAAGIFDGENAPAGDELRIRSGELAEVPSPVGVLAPIAPVRDAARAGLVNLSTDRGGVPRHVPMLFASEGAVMPSFVLAAASVALRTDPVFGPGTVALAGKTVDTDLGYHLPIRYYGPRGSIKRFSAARALRDDLAPDDIRGQVVLIGVTAVALGDTFSTPFDRVVPGVEIFATAMSNLLAGDALVRNGLVRRIDAAAAILIPCGVVLLMAVRRTAIGLALAAALVAAWGAAIVLGFLAGYWLSVAVPLAAAFPVAAAYGLARLAHARYATGRLTSDKAVLSRFQSPRLVEHILAHPEFLEQPVRQDAAVVFVDLSRFTGLAESLGPEQTRELLAQFHAIIERDALAHDGFVASFMGDGAMVLFGVPEPQSDDAARALRAIVELNRSIAEWVAALPPVAQDRVAARIGGHFGPVVMSRLGPADHQHVTATGDTVNVASRLLEVAKQQGASVVVSEDLWVAAAGSAELPAALTADAVREVGIRGRAKPLRIRVLH